ncbi:MAG: TolC family protein, partial [Verrucomicrobia bacterium]|nr:TolC family protein [Verrucomicrobiota bacterium]
MNSSLIPILLSRMACMARPENPSGLPGTPLHRLQARRRGKRNLLAMAWVPSLILSLSLRAADGSIQPAVPVDSLTLERATEIAERTHPQLAEAHALVDAAAGRAEQAGRLPNPELVSGAQQLPASAGGSNQREYIAGLSQPIPLGGRLGKARAAELLDKEVRVHGLEVIRRNLRRLVHSSFATALYQEEAFRILSQMTSHHDKATTAARARVEAGDAPSEELARVELEAARVRAEQQRAGALRDQSRAALAAAMGNPQMLIGSLSGNLAEAFELPALQELSSELAAQPQLRQAEAEVRASHARIVLARAERIPDVKVEALYHRMDSLRENTVDIGLSIPLPLFNRNQGRIREARAEAVAA